MRRGARSAATRAAAVLLLAGAAAAPAQEASVPELPAPDAAPAGSRPAPQAAPAASVLTVDQEALFQRSAFGRRFEADLQDEAAALATENRRIEAELAAEERALTDERPGMDPAEFRARAAAFDEKVVEIRRTQDQKSREIQRRPEEARQQFFRAAYPVLARIVQDRGAVAILDNRAVILSADSIDITDEAVAAVDAVLGEGTAVPPAESPAPGAAPDPEPAAPEPAAPEPAEPGSADPGGAPAAGGGTTP